MRLCPLMSVFRVQLSQYHGTNKTKSSFQPLVFSVSTLRRSATAEDGQHFFLAERYVKTKDRPLYSLCFPSQPGKSEDYSKCGTGSFMTPSLQENSTAGP
jgi:hypothetical protein